MEASPAKMSPRLTTYHAPNDTMASRKIVASMEKLQTYLTANFPNALIMPSHNGKHPMFKHVKEPYTLADFHAKGKFKCGRGALIILPEELIVVDVDEMEWAEKLMAAHPEFNQTVTCKTRTGYHFYFRRTPHCVLRDRARQLKDNIPLDIKNKGGVISIPPSPKKKWVRAIIKREILPIPDSFLQWFHAHEKPQKKKEPTVDVKKPFISPDDADHVKDARELVKLLKMERAENYPDWIRVGWCLHNINADQLLDAWLEFSQLCPSKYSETECRKLWHDMRNEGYCMPSLRSWARDDSPEAYKEFIRANITDDILACNGSHNSIAAIFNKLFKDTYVCAEKDGKLWYVFTGTLWEEDAGFNRIKRAITSDLCAHLNTVVEYVAASSTMAKEEKDQKLAKLMSIMGRLQDNHFKRAILSEMREFFYDKTFINKLDTNPNLIAFTNGVWELKEYRFRKALPCDYQSISVGFDYLSPPYDDVLHLKVRKYWMSLHPDCNQLQYVIKMFARQLYGDHGNELFHIHAGHLASAANGKSRFFEILHYCLGGYVQKFDVAVLTSKNRIEPGKPMPMFSEWRGVRILYCPEPNADEKLNSGIMKELTGGEEIQYRLLYSNETQKFRPMYKMHTMCNDPPLVEGSDSGGRRRIRKIDYMSRFVDESEVDESRRMFKKDPAVSQEFKDDVEMRMEFLHVLLDAFDYSYQFEMPDVIQQSSKQYLEENDPVHCFVQEYVIEEEGAHMTLADVREAYRRSDHYNGRLSTLKNDLIKTLQTPCHPQLRIEGARFKNVFLGYLLYDPMHSRGLGRDELEWREQQ